MYYLIEPYTIFQGKKKEKHWMQIAEEEALYYRMIQEVQQAQLTSQQLAQGVPVGIPPENTGLLNPKGTLTTFTVSPSSTGSAPYTVYLNAQAPSDLIRFCNWTWNFSDGTTASGPAISKTFNTGSIKISVTASSNPFVSQQFATQAVVRPSAVTASLPVVIANFTSSVQTGSIPVTVTFINLTTINQYTASGELPGVTYLWNFGSASATSTSTNPTITYYDTGSWIVRLEATGSYGIRNAKARFAVSASN